MADDIAAAGSVMSQAKMIGLTIFQFAFLFTIPMPKTAPIRICVELTGMPSFHIKFIQKISRNRAV